MFRLREMLFSQKGRIMRTLFSLALSLSVIAATSISQSLLDGRILQADGTPPRVGHFVVLNHATRKVICQAAVDAQGKFSLMVDAVGPVCVRMSAVDHQPSEASLYVVKGQAIHIAARLALNTTPDSISNVAAIGSFNHYSFEAPLSMKKEEDGAFSLAVHADSSKMTYQLLGTVPGRRSVNGQGSAAYELDPEGDYRSVVYPSGDMVTLRFDPRRAPHETNPAMVEVRNQKGAMDAITDILHLREMVLAKFIEQRDSVELAGKSVSLFKDDYDWHAAQRPLIDRLAEESIPFCRQAILISLFSSGRMDARDSTLGRKLLTEVPPQSRFWSISPLGTVENLGESLSAKAIESYTGDVIEKNPDPAVRAAFLLEALMMARVEGVGKEKAAHYYEVLTTEYAGSNEAAMARQLESPTKRVQVGQHLPGFRLPDLRDSTRYLTNSSFEGKFLLLDFWATWCAPCVKEIPGIHRAYEKYHGKGLEILSVSLDNKMADLQSFLQTRDAMPWHLVFAPFADRNALMETFDFKGIPRPLLVDRHGNIIAMENDLRGEGLDKTLQKAIDGSSR